MSLVDAWASVSGVRVRRARSERRIERRRDAGGIILEEYLQI